MNLYAVIEQQAHSTPGARAMVHGDRIVTYGELHQAVLGSSDLLVDRYGVGTGDRVALIADNGIEWIVAFLATIRIGAVSVPLHTGQDTHGLESAFIAVDCQAAIMDTQRIKPDGPTIRLHDLTRRGDDLLTSDSSAIAVDRPDSTLAVIYPTSGTSGRPKGVMCTHAHEAHAIERMAAYWGLTSGDVGLVGQPLPFVMGSMMTTVALLASGATVVLLDRFRPDSAATAARRWGATFLPGVPTMHRMITDYCRDERVRLDTLEWVVSGGDRVPSSLSTDFHRTFGVHIFDSYGLSEARPIAGYIRNQHDRPVPGSVGQIYPHVALEITADGIPVGHGETGEIVVSGDCVTDGYFNQPEESAQRFRQGRFFTRDIGRLDNDFLYVLGRADGLVKRGGLQIFPVEIEEQLCGHSQISSAVVVPVQDDRFGVELVAIVETNALSSSDIRAFCQSRLPAHKVPRHVIVLDEIPRGPSGKIARHQVEHLAQQTASTATTSLSSRK